jgi:hypothetical protein
MFAFKCNMAVGVLKVSRNSWELMGYGQAVINTDICTLAAWTSALRALFRNPGTKTHDESWVRRRTRFLILAAAETCIGGIRKID